MHLINASPLILPLAKREVDGREQGRYLLASFLVFSIPGYAGLLPSSGAGYSWALGFEAWFYIAIATFGVIAARDAADCAALDGTPGLDRLGLPGIGHGWDLPVVAAPGGALLPDPSGTGRRRAAPDPIATEAVATIVADWVSRHLAAPRP